MASTQSHPQNYHVTLVHIILVGFFYTVSLVTLTKRLSQIFVTTYDLPSFDVSEHYGLIPSTNDSTYADLLTPFSIIPSINF